YTGAIVYNQIQLWIDEICGRRPYESIIQEMDNTNKIYLYSLYEDTLLKALFEKMDRLYWSYKNYKRINIEIEYFNPCLIDSWCVRRYIILENGYKAEIHYKDIGK